MKTTERFALSAEYTEHCIQIQLIEDTIVEIDEIFLVQLEQIISSNDLVFKPNPEYLEVTIENNDGGNLIYLPNHSQSSNILCIVSYLQK